MSRCLTCTDRFRTTEGTDNRSELDRFIRNKFRAEKLPNTSNPHQDDSGVCVRILMATSLSPFQDPWDVR